MWMNPVQAYVAPLTGATVNMTSEVQVVDPLGTLAALTVNLPGSPTRGQTATIAFTQVITALTMGGGTILGAPSAIAINTSISFLFNDTIGKWLRVF